MPSTPRCLQPPGTEVNRTRIGGFGVLAVDAAARCLAFSRREFETRILTRLGEDGTADDFRYYLRAHMTVNGNGVPAIDRTDRRMECK
jgi:hypothetical protein